MPGLRIHHPELRSCTLLVHHSGNKRTGRKEKDYHIHLNADGDAIVSERVWQRLQEARMQGSPHTFVLLNEVADPPTLNLGGAGPAEFRQTFRQAPDGRIVDENVQTVAQQILRRGLPPRVSTKKKV